MAAARRKLIDDIFLAAADMPPEEVERYVEQACSGDPSLIAEVEALLASDRTSELENKWIGRRIGPYTIVAEIGRGGMGAVYRAIRADDQYRRAVAVKVIAHRSEAEVLQARSAIGRRHPTWGRLFYLRAGYLPARRQNNLPHKQLSRPTATGMCAARDRRSGGSR